MREKREKQAMEQKTLLETGLTDFTPRLRPFPIG